MGSDGATAFQTPLATLHKPNSWADTFLDTLVRASRDRGFKDLLIKVIYHDFNPDEVDAASGRELEFLVSEDFGKIFTVAAEAAFCDADGYGTDTTKLWLTLGAKF